MNWYVSVYHKKVYTMTIITGISGIVNIRKDIKRNILLFVSDEKNMQRVGRFVVPYILTKIEWGGSIKIDYKNQKQEDRGFGMGKWYIGVDGGGTKTAIAVSKADSLPVQTMIYPTCSYQSIGITQSVALIQRGILECLAAVGAKLEDCAGCCVGMPCYGENSENDRIIAAELTRALAPVPVSVVNDGEVGWAGSLACEEGIHVVSGTGSIAFGRGENQGIARCGGWVEFFGDEGSCYWIGREAMCLFSKQADGRIARGALYELISKELGLKEDYQFIDRVMADIAPYRERVADFQRYVLQAAQMGDLAAIALYEKAAEELALMIGALKAKLRFSSEPVHVSYSGGLFHAGELVLKPLRSKVSALGCVLQTPKRSAIEGALMLAVEQFCSDDFASNAQE